MLGFLARKVPQRSSLVARCHLREGGPDLGSLDGRGNREGKAPERSRHNNRSDRRGQSLYRCHRQRERPCRNRGRQSSSVRFASSKNVCCGSMAAIGRPKTGNPFEIKSFLPIPRERHAADCSHFSDSLLSYKVTAQCTWRFFDIVHGSARER